MINGNSAQAQRQRILTYLYKQPLDTLTARRELDIMHPAARVMELRKRGIGIITVRIDRPSDCGKMHSVACYVLEVGAAATAPTVQDIGINEKEADSAKISMGCEL